MEAAPDIAAQLLADLPPADVLQVLNVFANEVQKLGSVLPAQAASGDRAGFRRSAHALAGAAGAIGAARLEQVARSAMRAHDAPDLTESLAAIGIELEHALLTARDAASRIGQKV